MMRAKDVRSLRPAKPAVEVWRPHGQLREPERLPDGRQVETLTIFLAGRECPFTCVFCDLWRYTTDEPTPRSAIPAQIEIALTEAGALPPDAHVKLYNASNFFDERAVPAADDETIAGLVSPFEQVVVECHPSLVRDRCLRFAERIPGRLQVAMGLETVHPEALPKLGKKLTLDLFARAAETLRTHDIGMRAFVLIGAPYVPPDEAALWAERSAEFAFEHGVEHVALIPVRGGNGALETLQREGAFTPPTFNQIEDAMARCMALQGGVVTVDVWDLDHFSEGVPNFAQRRAQLEAHNLKNQPD